MNRSGIGYDVHPLVKGRDLILGGTHIDYPKGLQGHSDADALCHAIADAILGSIGEKDIGHYFPDTDEQFRDINSIHILQHAANILAEKGGTINNVDCTIIAEKPKIMPYIPSMKVNIANALGITLQQISIKATTNEKMGALGRGEGIAALAIANVEA